MLRCGFGVAHWLMRFDRSALSDQPRRFAPRTALSLRKPALNVLAMAGMELALA
jgi:hypothetical protein